MASPLSARPPLLSGQPLSDQALAEQASAGQALAEQPLPRATPPEAVSLEKLWHWAIEGDEPQAGTEGELIRQLSTGRLPPYALVWREGWGEWLPAMQVQHLAEAFPDVGSIGIRTARPSMIPGVPPVPVSDYPRLRHLAKEAPLGWPDGFEGPEEEIITSEVPAVVMQEAARVMTQPTPPRDLGLQEAIERASRLPPERSSLLPRFEERTPVSSRALPLAAELGLEALMAESTPARSWSHWLRAHGLWLALVLLALGVGVPLGLRWFGLPRGWLLPARDEARQASPSPAISSVQPLRARPSPAAAGCHLRQPPVELDDWAVADVRPVLHPLASGREVAIGYAQSHRSATGGIIDVGSLRLERQFWQQQDRQVFSVTPLEVGGALRYHVERQGTNVAFARAVAAEPPVRLGMSEDRVVLGKLEQRVQELWPLPPGSTITVPEVAEHPLGFTLALRASRGVGQLYLGLINSAGAALAPLAELGNPEWDFGRPALASGPEQTLLAVCHHGGLEQGDELLLARARNGQLPTGLRPFARPAPAATPEQLSAPVVAALPDGGFALMWSQGPEAQRQVRLQRLSAELQPLGPVFDVTPAAAAGVDATAAALHWVDDRLLAFYFSKREAGHSLWVGSLSCGA